MTLALDLRARRRARGGRPAVRGRHGRGGQAADLGAPGGVGDRPSGRHDRGLGRRQLRAARRRARGAPRAGRRSATPAAPVQGHPGRGPARRRRRRTGHDLPFRGHAGDLRGTASARAGPVGGRHDAHRRAPSSRSARPPAGGSRSSTRSPTRTTSRAPSVSSPARTSRGSTPGLPRPWWSPRKGSGTRRRSPPRSPATCPTSGLVASPTRAAVVRAWLRDEAGDPRGAPGRACVPRPASTSAPRLPRRSPCRSSPSSSRSGAARAAFVASPGPATLAGGAPAPEHPARRRRHRAARPGLRHDRGPRPRPPPRRARRHRLRVLLDRLPDPLHPEPTAYITASVSSSD